MELVETTFLDNRNQWDIWRFRAISLQLNRIVELHLVVMSLILRSKRIRRHSFEELQLRIVKPPYHSIYLVDTIDSLRQLYMRLRLRCHKFLVGMELVDMSLLGNNAPLYSFAAWILRHQPNHPYNTFQMSIDYTSLDLLKVDGFLEHREPPL